MDDGHIDGYWTSFGHTSYGLGISHTFKPASPWQKLEPALPASTATKAQIDAQRHLPQILTQEPVT